MNQWVSFTSLTKGPATTGQICQIYGVPVEWISIFPKFDPETQYLDGNIVLDYQKTWFKFNPGASGKFFDESTKALKGRTFWEQKISFNLFWQSGPQDVKLQNMINHRWVFLFKEAGTGIYYVVGKPPVGATVSIGYTNKQGTVTEISANFQSIHRAPLYTGVNQSMYRYIDEDGNFIVDEDGNYLGEPGPITLAPDGTLGEFSGTDFTNDDFFTS